MLSMMSFVIQRAAMGSREAISRKISPKETTTGPDSQTIRSTGGTLRSAESRSNHPLQKLSRLAISLISQEECRFKMLKSALLVLACQRGHGIDLFPVLRPKSPWGAITRSDPHPDNIFESGRATTRVVRGPK